MLLSQADLQALKISENPLIQEVVINYLLYAAQSAGYCKWEKQHNTKINHKFYWIILGVWLDSGKWKVQPNYKCI